MKKVKELDRVALVKDLPDDGLKAGDPGTVVHVGKNGWIIVEFVDIEGFTVGLADLKLDDVRPATEADAETRAIGRREVFYPEESSTRAR
jgi:hypothetical protein